MCSEKGIRKRNSSQRAKIKANADSKTCVKQSTISPGEIVLVRRPFAVSKGEAAYGPTAMTVAGMKGSMNSAGNEDRSVTRNSSFFKNLNQPADSCDDNESHDNSFDSQTDKECIQETPAVAPTMNAPDPAPPKLVDTSHHKVDLPKSSNHIAESHARASHPDGQRGSRRSTGQRIPREILGS